MTAAITEAYVDFLTGMTSNRVPPAARDVVTGAFIDTVGVMLAGSKEEIVDILLRSLDRPTGNSGARICMSDHFAPAPDAALVSGTAAHALDFDDVAVSSHPSAVLVPALLAEGDVLSSSGADIITAYLSGFEVWADLARRGGNFHRKGWHPTAIFGPIATAAAVSTLHRLPRVQTRNALAIAASHSSGLVANFGTMTKPYHAGLSARNGITAVRLAANGMVGSSDIIEHDQGFLRAFSSDREPDRETPVALGDDWNILRLGLNVKRYPTCYATHRSIDAMIELSERHDLQARDVAAIRVRMGSSQAAALQCARPTTALEAKFSEEFAMACALVHRKVGLRELSNDVVTQEGLRAIFEKVQTIKVDEYDPEDAVFSPTEDVVVTLNDGRVLEVRDVRHAKGHARNPLGPAELRAKFDDCAEAAGIAEAAGDLFGALGDLASLGSMRDLPTMPVIGQ